MASLLRIIRKNRWYIEEARPYLQSGDIPADPLADLRTEKNSLSVWLIEDDKSNLEQVIAAFAATRQSLDHVDFALFDVTIPSEIHIKCEKSAGDTPDDRANESWHFNLRELSGLGLVALAKAILEKGQKERILEADVRELIKTAISKGQLDAVRMKPDLMKKVSG
jgi:hypothetical protein